MPLNIDPEINNAAGGTTGRDCRLLIVLQQNYRGAEQTETEAAADLKPLFATWHLVKETEGTTQAQATPAVGPVNRTGGRLTIEADGTFVWQVSPHDRPERHLRGRWRRADQADLQFLKGPGIVLLQARDGVDWVVTRDSRAPVKGDQIRVNNLKLKAMEWFGRRD